MNEIPAEILEFYNQLESINSFDRWHLVNNIDALSEIYNGYWKEALIAERISLNFMLRDGHLAPFISNVTKEGKEVGFPMLNNFNEEHILYLKNRIESTKNPYLISRYNHILYELDKNNKYAINAIEAYKLITYKKFKTEIEGRLFNTLPALIKLTEKSKYKHADTKKELLDLVQSKTLSITDKFFIFKTIAASKLFKSNELAFFPEKSFQWFQKENAYYFQNIEILELAVKISINNRKDPTQLYEMLAENEDLLLSEHTEDNDFMKPEIYARKMDFYKKANNNEKYKISLIEYSRVKSLAELKLMQIPMDEGINRILNESINEHVKKSIKWESDRILFYLSRDSSLYPDINNVIAEAKKNYQNSFTQFATTTAFDINNNLKRLTSDEKFQQDVFRSYEFRLSLIATIYFSKLLANSILNGKISYFVVHNYFLKHSWFGQELPKSKMKSISIEEETYCWLDLLAPGLFKFFSMSEAYVLSGLNNQFNNWVLCIDSLSLKIEGALRDFIRLLGGGTSKIKDGVTKEMNLEELLNSDKANEIFSENDLELFKMVLTNKGMNIRNNVAHSFYDYEDYTFEKACKIIFCVLRLGNYKLTISKQDKPS